MQDYDDEPVQRPKWLGWVIIIGMALVVLGLLNVGLRLYFTDSSKPAVASAESAVQATTELAGKRLVNGSDCMRCHGVERNFVGPAFQEIAQRYRDREDVQTYLARKIREGSVGEWGRTLMPRHPQITQAQAEEMAQWIISLPAPQP